MSDNPLSEPKRCAIYTRKSTNSRLEHEVNSLTTQHEICTAYILSQRYRGWTALARRYDDVGHSGSGLERPALAALMHDIEAGEIDTVVVYKIDRLTRSLLDFVRLIEIFDRRAVGLVSVSQAFDTADSMGRMSMLWRSHDRDRGLCVLVPATGTTSARPVDPGTHAMTRHGPSSPLAASRPIRPTKRHVQSIAQGSPRQPSVADVTPRGSQSPPGSRSPGPLRTAQLLVCTATRTSSKHKSP